MPKPPSPAALILRGGIFVYRHTLSALLGRQCRFTPSCAAYADEAVRRHGAIKGGGLAVRRLCRCHPFARLGGGHGYDPLP